MTRVKICGLRSVEDAAIVNAVRPDFAGMIFAPGRRRTISHETAASIRAALDSSIPAVGVFVRNSPEEILSLAEQHIIQYIQLHGGEDEAFLSVLRQHTALPIIKAFRITSEADLRAAAQSTADHILLDSGIGGTGECFDWSLLRTMARPYFLAGGLDPENAGAVVTRFAPYCVDVSSGVEENGIKNMELCARFVSAVRKNSEEESL